MKSATSIVGAQNMCKHEFVSDSFTNGRNDLAQKTSSLLKQICEIYLSIIDQN